MESTMDLVEDFVNFGTKQASLVFGENSALSELILSGFGPLIENIDSIFNALESLINFKRNILDTFLSENYDREKLLRKLPIKSIDQFKAAVQIGLRCFHALILTDKNQPANDILYQISFVLILGQQNFDQCTNAAQLMNKNNGNVF